MSPQPAASKSIEAEWQELIERIKKSAFFKKANDKCRLLDYLWQHRGLPRSDINVEVEVYDNKRPQDEIDASRARVALGDVRERLRSYRDDTKGEKWHVGLPEGRGGYRLEFELATKSASPTRTFWNAHLWSFANPVVITGSHLFFWEPDNSKIIRYYDFNESANLHPDDLIEKLRRAHPDLAIPNQPSQSLEPWRDVYLASGDVRGYEALAQWFHVESGILIKRITSRQVTEEEVLSKNPILFGRPETNPVIKTLMDSPSHASKFAFRIHPLKGAVRVSNLGSKELEDLKKKFPVSTDGVVGPMLDDGKVFGIVTRFPNPGGNGSVTIVACGHYAMVIFRIIEALTDDNRARQLLEQMDWSVGEPLPDAFEILFTVKLSPGGLPGEGFPELVTWRPV